MWLELQGEQVEPPIPFSWWVLKPKSEREGQSSHAIVERMKQNAPWQAGAIFSARVEQELELDDPFSEWQWSRLYAVTTVRWGCTAHNGCRKLHRPCKNCLRTLRKSKPWGMKVHGLCHPRCRPWSPTRRLGVDIESISSVLNNSFFTAPDFNHLWSDPTVSCGHGSR